MKPRWVGGSIGLLVFLAWLAADQLMEPGISLEGIMIGLLVAMLVGSVVAIIWKHDLP